MSSAAARSARPLPLAFTAETITLAHGSGGKAMHDLIADSLLAAMQVHPAGRESAVIGKVAAAPARCVILCTSFGGERIVDVLVGEQLPRIY